MKLYIVVFILISKVASYILDDYCQPNKPAPYAVPDGYEIRQAHIIYRHGDRSPYKQPPQWNTVIWNCTLPVYTSVLDTSQPHRLAYVSTGSPLRGNCAEGQLTALGGSMMRAVGESLWQIYGEKFGLLSNKPGEQLIYSSYDERCVQSSAALWSGLYPSSRVTMPPADIISYFEAADYLDAAFSCPQFFVTLNESQLTPEFQNWEEKVVVPLVEELAKATNMTIDEMSGMFSYMVPQVAPFYCHRQPFPAGITMDLMTRTTEALQIYWKYGFTYPGMRSWLAAPHLNDMLPIMKAALTGKSPTEKMVHWSTHDFAIFPLLVLLDQYPNSWVGYSSQLIFEIWSGPSGNMYLRALYNGQLLSLKCSDSYGLCPAEDVITMLEAGLSSDWVKYCKASDSKIPQSRFTRRFMNKN